MHDVRNIQHLVEQIKYGEILLPEFQRGYVWNRQQAKELVESLYKNHPTGHLLMWTTYDPTPIRAIETLVTDPLSCCWMVNSG